MPSLQEYGRVVGEETIHELELFAGKLSQIVVQHINSTSVGGGVAEILMRMVPLFKDVGITAHWDVIKGGEKFFAVTKKIHNSLHGQHVQISQEELDLFVATNEVNSREMDFRGDVLFIHDPQPIGLVDRRKEIGRHWIWRCHIDFSRPEPSTWKFLKTYIEKYDASIFSAPAFARELKTPQVLVAPSIDPLSDKNRELDKATIESVLTRFKLDIGRPIVTQISRFDYLKDPKGVIQVFRRVRKYIDCQLVLAGGGATDDPEGGKVLAEVQEIAANDPDIFLLLLPPGSDIEINALQRASSVILQKSLREGFGLTVAEALWKSKPVIASAVGGIPLQIAHRYSGLLTHTIEGTALALKQLLQNRAYAERLGANGHEHIKKNYLITRHLRDYLLVLLSLKHAREPVVYL